MDVFALLAEPVRHRIIEILATGEHTSGQLADVLHHEFGVGWPAVSRHLRVLREAGLVDEVPRGTRRIYHLQEEGIEAVRAYLEQVWGDAATRFRLTAENTRKRAR